MAEINLSQLSEFYGKNRSTIRQWMNRGCPVLQRGGRGKQTLFDSVEVAEWLEEQAINNAVGDTKQADAEELKRRKLAADTSLAEIEAAKAKGEVVYIDDAVKIVTDDILSAKARLRNVPSRVTPQIVGETDETRIQEIIAIEIDHALEELSNRFIEISDDPEEAAE